MVFSRRHVLRARRAYAAFIVPLAYACATTASCSRATSLPEDAPADAAVDVRTGDAMPGDAIAVTIGTRAVGPVNRKLLGGNIEWTGDGVVDGSGNGVDAMLRALARTGPSLMRYPGGTLADGFSFPNSVAPASSRSDGIDLAGARQPMVLGTAEFLRLCAALGSSPLFTVNVFTAQVTDAVSWVQYAADAGKQGLPAATYWEIGNEPYLDSSVYADGGKDTMSPSDFVARANEFLARMRSADPAAKLSIPVRTDTLNGVPIATKPGYLDAVLGGITEPFDLASVHDGYLPWDVAGKASALDVFLAAAAASLALSEQLDVYRARLDKAFPGRNIRFALTEWHPLVSLQISSLPSNATPAQLAAANDADQRANSIAGAIYTADVIAMLSYRPDVELASFWSSANDYIFGAVVSGGMLRPTGLALEAASETLQGDLLAVTVQGAPTIAAPSVGGVHAFDSVQALAGVAARMGDQVRILLVNKHPTASATLRVAPDQGDYASVQARVLTTPGLFDHSDAAELKWMSVDATGGVVTLPPHALARIDAR